MAKRDQVAGAACIHHHGRIGKVAPGEIVTDTISSKGRDNYCPSCGSHDPAQKFRIKPHHHVDYSYECDDPWHTSQLSGTSGGAVSSGMLRYLDMLEDAKAAPLSTEASAGAEKLSADTQVNGINDMDAENSIQRAAPQAPSVVTESVSPEQDAFDWLKKQPGPIGIIDVPRLMAEYASSVNTAPLKCKCGGIYKPACPRCGELYGK